MTFVQSHPSGVCLHAMGVIRAARHDAASLLEAHPAPQARGVKLNETVQSGNGLCPGPVDAGFGDFAPGTGGCGAQTSVPAAFATPSSNSLAFGGSNASLVFGAA